MRLYTAALNGEERLFVSLDGGKELYLLSDLGYCFRDMNELICTVTEEQMEAIRNFDPKASCSKSYAFADLALCAPIPRPLQDVVCLGINYASHAEEAGRFSKEDFGGEREYTIYFSKRVNRALGSGEAVHEYAKVTEKLDYEAELGVIIGRDASGVSQADAPSYIFGYTIINDMTARDIQHRHKQWYLGKSLDGFTPMGPCIVTPDEIGDPTDLDIRCYVNGELRQSSNTSLMLQTVNGAISELTAGMTLLKASIIATGTPAGVGMGMIPPTFLKKGDRVVCEIENIGKLETVIGE